MEFLSCIVSTFIYRYALFIQSYQNQLNLMEGIQFKNLNCVTLTVVDMRYLTIR